MSLRSVLINPAPVAGQENADLKLSLEHFEGPLDLLIHLIEKNRIDIYNIPITQITDQYLVYLEQCQVLDMEIASEFLVMAATLLHIKSRLLLPSKISITEADLDDPRDELVLKLLAYRRCKMLAVDLKSRQETFSRCRAKPPESPGKAGINTLLAPERLNRDQFWLACQRVVHQNTNRFNDLSSKITTLLRREKVSLKEKMRQILQHALQKTKLFFNELFPADRSSKAERVTGFLAVLELLRLGRITARQDHPFDVIEIEVRPESDWHAHDELDQSDLQDRADPIDHPTQPDPTF
ncbi:MAG: segregation/condensation protein A [Eubacteriales bacterium]|nr:segregation/condensation protein A [Eubacteriales bacterium]